MGGRPIETKGCLNTEVEMETVGIGGRPIETKGCLNHIKESRRTISGGRPIETKGCLNHDFKRVPLDKGGRPIETKGCLNGDDAFSVGLGGGRPIKQNKKMKHIIRQILKEEVSERLNQIIKKRLSKVLSNDELIYDDIDESIWLIDRENKYWYLELKKSGKLLWRYHFFIKFFALFSMKQSEFEPIIEEWMEDLLKRKVVSTHLDANYKVLRVEDLLKRKVVSTFEYLGSFADRVEDLLNRIKK